jgi:hypothetical protein
MSMTINNESEGEWRELPKPAATHAKRALCAVDFARFAHPPLIITTAPAA